MNKKLLAVVAMILLATVALSSCSVLNTVKDFFMDIFAPSVELTDEALKAEKIIDFKDGANPDVLFESDGWSNGDVFNVVWKKHNVKYENGIMTLGITEEKATAWVNDVEVEYDYTAGEARTQNYYHYGDYEVSMKPSANPGTASTFFVCTGPYDLKDGVPNAHDEIDIEFLGDDTTHVQFNFFVGGKGGNEYMYDLGFDASEGFHTYGFRWLPDSITWFVDGEPVYKVTTDTSVKTAGNLRVVEKLPSTAGRILTNYWCGNQDAWAWMGQYQGAIKDNGTEYQWIATSAEGAPLNPVEPPVDTNINWEDIDAIAPEFTDTNDYTVAIDGDKTTVTYTAVGGGSYANVNMNIADEAAGNNYFRLSVTNNGENAAKVRVNIYKGVWPNSTQLNLSATQDGAAVNTDLSYGGSFFEIAAGATAELVVKFGPGAETLELMIDSHTDGDSNTYAGEIVINDMKFAAVGEVEAPHTCNDADEDGKCDECGEDMTTTPEIPTSGNLTLNFGEFTTTIGGNTADGYGVNVDENNNINVKYNSIVGDSYKNIWANVSAIAGTKTAFTAKVTNHGTSDVTLRVDIESETKTSPNTTCCNVSATLNGAEVSTDKEWGGSTFTIPAGATVEIVVNYDASAKPTNVKIMIDSSMYGNSNVFAGEVTISEINFTGEYIPESGEPADTGLQPTFWTSSPDYTVNGNNIKYNGAGNAYSCAGFDVASIAAGNNTFTITITNNGSADSRVRVDVQGDNKVGNHTVINTFATGGDVWTDMEWGGSIVTVPAGESVTLVITYDVNTDRGAPTDVVIFVDAARGTGDTYSSDVTLSGMAFSNVSAAPTYEYTDLYVEWKTENAYTITTTDTYVNSARIAYVDMAKNSWANINMWVEDKSAGCSVFSMKLTNHGDAQVSVWVQMKSAGGDELINQNVNIGAGAEETFTFTYDGTAQMIFFFVDSTHEAGADLNTGDITISEIKLGK